MAQPQRGLAGRAGCPRRAHGAADLLLLPDHHLRAEVLDREGHLRRGPAPVAGAHHRPDLGRRAEQLVDPEGVLAEPQDAHPRPDPGRAQRVGQPVDPFVQFGPGQAVFPVGQRQPARVAAAVLGDDVPDGDHGLHVSFGHGDPLAGPAAAARAVRQRPAQAQRRLAHLVRPRARGADEQLAAAFGQDPLRAVEVGAAAVRALHGEGGPDPGDGERLGARPGQQPGGVRPCHDDRHPRHDRGELVAQALGHGPVEAEDHRDRQPACVHAGAERLEGVDLPDRVRRAELAGRGLERVEPGRFRHAADDDQSAAWADAVVGQHGARPRHVTPPVVPADLEEDRLAGDVVPADAPWPGPGERRGRRARRCHGHDLSPALMPSPPGVVSRRGRGRAAPARAAARAPAGRPPRP